MRSRLGLVAATIVTAWMLAAALPAAGSAKTVWLCLPGRTPDPCTPGLSTTVYTPKLKKLGVVHPQAVKNPPIDCFYVYPTASPQLTGNSNLAIGPAQTTIARDQAARYSQYCKVYAPMYRQVTLVGLGAASLKPTTPPNYAIGPADVAAALTTYLKKYNHGRGFVLIGQSQGASVLRLVISKVVDPKPSVRKRLLSAILMGGNVLVKAGQDVGGDFQHIPGCHSATQLGCVIAFSTFDQPVPAFSLFGRPLPTLGTTTAPGEVVLCTNPAALAGHGILDPILASRRSYPGNPLNPYLAGLGQHAPKPPTVFWTAPGSYSARCSSANDAHVLQITPRRGAVRPTPSPAPSWGLHLLDGGIALGNLVTIVKDESAAYVHRHG